MVAAPGGGWLRGLRLVMYMLIVLAMAEPRLDLPERAGTVVVLADRSASMPAEAQARQLEAIALLQESMSMRNRLAVVTFGREVGLEQGSTSEALEAFRLQVGSDASNLTGGLQRALSLIPGDGSGRILLLSDGRYTGADPQAQAARAGSRGVAIDYRELSRPVARDLAIVQVDAPDTAAPGESFMITGWAYTPTAQRVSFVLSRGEKRIATGDRSLPAGLSRMTFRDTAPRSGGPDAADRTGSLNYRLTLTATITASSDAATEDSPNENSDPAEISLRPDPMPENNEAQFLVGVTGKKPLLLISDAPGRGLAALLAASGLDVVTTSPDQLDARLDRLASYAGVILENVSATDLPDGTLDQLSALVQTAGSGLAMTGGQRSFGPGGYFKSALDPVLPVSMELRQEHRKLSLAIVVALDRSGSMAMTVPDGRTKMDLANLGTAQVLDLLSPADELGVIAVDSAPHTILNLQAVTDKAAMKNKILSIDSMGGGIYVYEALAASAGMLAEGVPTTRHIILFADAQDAEQPGQYRTLLEKAGRANMTVSVIGLGQPTDVDAPLLRDVAARGAGRAFFTDDPKQLPQLFAQDTFVVARSSFIDEPTAVRTTGGLTALTGRSFTPPPTVGGYNLNYLKPQAQLALATTDEYAAPLVATWNAGLGRVAVYTGEADGKFTGEIAAWSEFGELLSSLSRWIAADDRQLPERFYVRQRVDDGQLTVELFLPPDAAGTLPQEPRLAVLMSGPDRDDSAGPTVLRPRMTYTAPDVLAATVPLQGQQIAVASLDLGELGRTTLAPTRLLYSPEYQPRGPQLVGRAARDGKEILQQLARVTGGQPRPELSGIWQDLPPVPRPVSLAHYFWLAAVLLLIIEILERRTAALSHLTSAIRSSRTSASTSRTAADSVGAPPPSSHRARKNLHREKMTKSGWGKGTQLSQPASTTNRKTDSSPAADMPQSPDAGGSPTSPPAPAGSILDALSAAKKHSDQRTRR